MSFDPVVRVRFDTYGYNNPVQIIWDWCEAMNIDFEFLGFETAHLDTTDFLHTLTIWSVREEHDNLTFRLRWGSV